MARTTEQRLLMLCAAREASPAARSESRALAAGGDWRAVIDLAVANGMLPLLRHGLLRAHVACPAHLHERMAADFAEVTASNMSRCAQASRLLQILDAAGVRAALCKGPVLASRVYGHLGLRPCHDIDVLVGRRDIHRARDAVLGAGYTQYDATAGAFGGIWPQADREVVLFPEQLGLTVVELQTTVANWPLAVRLESETLVGRSIEINTAGAALRTLANEDHLLVLVLHGFRHLWESIRLIADIDWAVGAPLQWSLVFERARDARMERMLAAALMLSRSVFQTRLPVEVLERIEGDRVAARMSARIERRLFASRFFRKITQDSMWIACRERTSDKLRFITRLMAEKLIRSYDHLAGPSDARGMR